MTLSLLFNQAPPRSGSLGATDQDDAGAATAALPIVGSLAVTESPQGLPGAYWSTRYWATGYWSAGYWVPNTPPNHVLVGASLARGEVDDSIASSAQEAVSSTASLQEVADALVSIAVARVAGSASSTEAIDALTATGTAAGGIVSTVSGVLAVQDDDDILFATAARAGAVLPPGAVGWWPQTARKRRASAALSVIDESDRVAARARIAPSAVARLTESLDSIVALVSVQPGAISVLVEVADIVRASGHIDWSSVIAQEDEAFAFGVDGMLMDELLKEAA